jgi:hypothetical protein
MMSGPERILELRRSLEEASPAAVDRFLALARAAPPRLLAGSFDGPPAIERARVVVSDAVGYLTKFSLPPLDDWVRREHRRLRAPELEIRARILAELPYAYFSEPGTAHSAFLCLVAGRRFDPAISSERWEALWSTARKMGTGAGMTLHYLASWTPEELTDGARASSPALAGRVGLSADEPAGPPLLFVRCVERARELFTMERAFDGTWRLRPTRTAFELFDLAAFPGSRVAQGCSLEAVSFCRGTA